MSSLTMNGFDTYIRTELGLSEATLTAYKKDVQEFLDFVGAQQLTAHSIEVFLSHLRYKKLKATTVRRKYMSIRCFCHHLSSLGLLDHNIIDTIDPVRVERKTSNALESEAVDVLVAAVESRVPTCRATNIRRDVAIILMLYHSGLRASELCCLNFEDVNFSRREIRVRGKGNRDRVVPTTHKCIDSIKSYIHTDRISSINAIFVNSNGQRITRRAISDMLTRLSRSVGIKHTTAHTLRRSCATSLMDRGVDLDLVQALLGHQNLSTTQSYLVTNIDKLKTVHKRCHPLGEKNESPS